MGYEVRGVRDGACGAYEFAEPLPPTMSFAEMLAATRRAADNDGTARHARRRRRRTGPDHRIGHHGLLTAPHAPSDHANRRGTGHGHGLKGMKDGAYDENERMPPPPPRRTQLQENARHGTRHSQREQV